MHDVLGHERVAVIGGDVGGVVLFDLGLRYPGWVARQVLFNTLPPPLYALYADTGGWRFESYPNGDRNAGRVGDKTTTMCWGCHAQRTSHGVFSVFRAPDGEAPATVAETASAHRPSP